MLGFFTMYGCAGRGGETPQNDTSGEAVSFSLPVVPDSLTTAISRADYLAEHYWDGFDFSDTSLLHCPEVTEQAFVDFVHILPHSGKSREAFSALYEGASSRPEMLDYFMVLSDKYLSDIQSPVRNESLYITSLEVLLSRSDLASSDRVRLQYRLDLSLKNREGSTASDFEYLCSDGSTRRLSSLSQEFTLLFFHDPDCDDCRRVERYLASSPVLSRLISEGRLAVLAVSVEGAVSRWREVSYPSGWINGCDAEQYLSKESVYDLRAIPSLYLLGRNRRVLCKDASAEAIVLKLSEPDAVSR